MGGLDGVHTWDDQEAAGVALGAGPGQGCGQAGISAGLQLVVIKVQQSLWLVDCGVQGFRVWVLRV